ncbi:MAG TPA: hypothetical protein VFQ04_11260, partial [Actinomycetes bacterium]|nr:hypothetical protein [Actinomycetes bacterium]
MTSTAVDRAFELLESKLRRPIDRRVGVPRTGLVDRLITGKAPIVGIFAGPGYGKTTLLTQWADADPRPFAWVALDERDNDPVVLLTYIAEALHRVEPLPPAVFEALSAPGAGIQTVVVPRLVAAVSGRANPSVLVLDDVHVLQDQVGLEAIATLIVGRPEAFQIAVAGRAEPRLPLARLRAHGAVLDLGPEELAFDAREASVVLRATNVHLPKTDVVGLVGRTEGWPVGVYLAALSIRAGGGAPAVAGFAGDDRLVGDYLRQEVLARLPQNTTSFLTRTSVLEELSGPLCDAVLGQTGSPRTLEAIAHQNLLVVPLDRRQTWYRYHHLFRDLLRAELGRREPELVPELQRRAAHWCEDHGRAEAALDYAQAAGDADHAAQLFAWVSLLAYSTGRLATVRRWLEWFEQHASIERYPTVALIGALLLTLVGEAEGAARLAAAAEAAEGGWRDELFADGVTPVQVFAALLGVMMCQRGMARLGDDVRLALDLTPDVSPQLCTTLLFSGMARLLAGEDDAADDDFADAAEIGLHMSAWDSVGVAFAERSVLAMARGDWAAADGLTQQARAFVREHRLDD